MGCKMYGGFVASTMLKLEAVLIVDEKTRRDFKFKLSRDRDVEVPSGVPVSRLSRLRQLPSTH